MIKKLNWQFKKHSVLWIALAGILILFICSKALYQYFTGSHETPVEIIQVETIHVKEAPMLEVVNTIGNLTAEKEVTLKGVDHGRVQQILVESGSFVKQGTLLATIVGAPEVRAPFDGYLTDWQVKSGAIVERGESLVELVNTDRLELSYRIPENFAPKLDIGQTVEVSVSAFANRHFTGTVRFIAPIVDRKTHTILIRATVENPNQDLWPGMSAQVTQVLAVHPSALVIPEACLKLTLEGYEVFVVREGKIQKRAVEIGDRQNGRVHILSGVQLNEPVVMTRTNIIEEGKIVTQHDWSGDW